MVGRRATPPISSFCRKTTQNLLPYALYFKRTVAWICVMQARGWCLQHITRAAASTPPPPYLVFQVSLFKRAETGKMTSCSVEDGFLSQSTRCAHVRSSRTCSARRPSVRSAASVALPHFNLLLTSTLIGSAPSHSEFFGPTRQRCPIQHEQRQQQQSFLSVRISARPTRSSSPQSRIEWEGRRGNVQKISLRPDWRKCFGRFRLIETSGRVVKGLWSTGRPSSRPPRLNQSPNFHQVSAGLRMCAVCQVDGCSRASSFWPSLQSKVF